LLLIRLILSIKLLLSIKVVLSYSVIMSNEISDIKPFIEEKEKEKGKEESQKIIKLETKDGTVHSVNIKHLQNCETISSILETYEDDDEDDDDDDEDDDDDDEDIIPIKPVDDETFYICLDYLSQIDVDYGNASGKPSIPSWLYDQNIYGINGELKHKKGSYIEIDPEYHRKWELSGDEKIWFDKHFKDFNKYGLKGEERNQQIRKQELLLKTMLAANYLEINGLVTITCRVIGYSIQSCETDEDIDVIRIIFGSLGNSLCFDDDFTDKRREEVEEEAKWAEEIKEEDEL